MSNTTRAIALSPNDPPPPRRASSSAALLMPIMLIAGFLPGLIIGVSLGSPPPPSPDRCIGAPDVVACLIQSND